MELLITIIIDQTLCYVFESSSLLVLSFKRIWKICLVDEGYRNIIQKSIVTRAPKISKKKFLYTRFRALIFSVNCSIETTLVKVDVLKLMYLPMKVDVSLTFGHIAQSFSRHLHEPVTLSSNCWVFYYCKLLPWVQTQNLF